MKNFLTMILLFTFTQGKSQVPNWVWSRSATMGATGYGEGLNVTTDKAGNIFSTGSFGDSTITFGAFTLYNYHTGDEIYLAKYDSSGNVLWATSPNGSFTDVSYSVATDSIGNSYITGFFISPTIIFGTDTLTNYGGYDIFIAKYNSSGNVLWAKNAGGTLRDEGISITTDAVGNSYVTGYFYSRTITAGSFTLTNNDTSGTTADIFLIKYDSLGNVIWAKSAGGNSIDWGYGLTTDISGNALVTGVFYSDTLIFGTSILSKSGFLLAKYDSSGNTIWAKDASSGSGLGYGVASKNSGNIYVTGLFTSSTITFGSHTLTSLGNGDCFVTKYDSSGNVLWAKSFGGTIDELGYSIAADDLDNVYVSGKFTSPSISLDTITLQYPTGGTDPMFITELDSVGNILWAKAMGSGSDDQSGIAVIPSGSIYIVGDFMMNPFIVGNDTLILTGGEAPFISKLSFNSEVGISEISNNSEEILFPNPFDVKLNVTVKGNEQTEIILYDILSRKLLQRNFTNTTTINTEQLASGLYIYELRNKNGILANGKVIKQ